MPYGKTSNRDRNERAKRRDQRTAVFHKQCDDKIKQAKHARELWEMERERKDAALARASMTDEQKLAEQELANKLYKLEDRLAAMKKNGFSGTDIVALHKEIWGQDWWGQGNDIILYRYGHIALYARAFVGYLDAYDLFDACCKAGIFDLYYDALGMAHVMGHTDFTRRCEKQGWSVSSSCLDGSYPTFGFHRDNLVELQMRLSANRPKIAPYADTVYRLRPLSQLLA